MTAPRVKGQALVEVALTLPILLILLGGVYAATRTAFLASRAESASFAEAIRAGRNLRGIGPELSRSVSPERNTVEIQPNRRGKSRLLPAPLPSLAGKTTATVNVRKTWPEIGNPEWLATTNIVRKTTLSADCWGKETPSGKRLQRWILGRIVLGTVR